MANLWTRDAGHMTYTVQGQTVDFQLSRTKVTATPEYDESGRTLKWVHYVINCDAYATVGFPPTQLLDTTSVTLSMRQVLDAPAGELKYLGKGNDIHVNGNSKVSDVNWGPKTHTISFVPMGDQAALVSWQVECWIPECVGGNARYNGLLAFVYAVDFDIDQDGYTTRTVSGHIIIAQTRSPNSRIVNQNADGWRNRVRPDVPEGFQRMPARFRVSPDRNRLDFTFVDKQLRVPYPDGVSTIEMDQEVWSQLKGGPGAPTAFTTWGITFSATINLPPDQPKSKAWDVFLLVLSSRVAPNWRFRNLPVLAGAPEKAFMPLRLTMGESIFGKGSKFQASFLMLDSSLAAVLRDSQLWQPIRGTSFASYKKSLLNSAFHERGQAKLTLVAGEETLIDLCTGSNPAPAKTTPGKVPTAERKAGIQKPPPPKAPLGGWFYYRNALNIVSRQRIAVHKRLPLAPPMQQQQVDFLAIGDAANLNLSDAPAIVDPQAPKPDIVQQLGSASYAIRMMGEALRWGDHIPVPQLVKVGGIPVTEIWRQAEEEERARVGGLPIYFAHWEIWYVLPQAFRGERPNLANPVYDTAQPRVG